MIIINNQLIIHKIYIVAVCTERDRADPTILVVCVLFVGFFGGRFFFGVLEVGLFRVCGPQLPPRRRVGCLSASLCLIQALFDQIIPDYKGANILAPLNLW